MKTKGKEESDVRGNVGEKRRRAATLERQHWIRSDRVLRQLVCRGRAITVSRDSGGFVFCFQSAAEI